MAYEPTDVFIPCPNNGFIVEGYTKSYKFYIDRGMKERVTIFMRKPDNIINYVANRYVQKN